VTYSSEVLADSPGLFLRLGEASGSTAEDDSGNNRDGSYVASPTLGVTGALTADANTAVTLNGTTQYVEIANAAWQNTSTLTLEAWIKTTTAANSARSVWDRDSSTAAQRVFNFNVAQSGGKLRFTRLYNAAGTGVFDSVTSVQDVNDGVWHHVAVTYDGTTAVLYIDGVVDKTATMSGGIRSTSTTPLRVGAKSTTTPSEFLPGSLDEAAYYTTALSAERIARHYLAGIAHALVAYPDEVAADSALAYYRLGDAGGDVSVATSSTNFAADPASKAFDGSAATWWTTNAVSTGWLRAELASAAVLTAYAIRRRDDIPNRNPNTWTFEGSNDGSSWTTLDTQTGITWPTAGETKDFTFANSTSYLYYRLNVTANNGDTYMGLAELVLRKAIDSSGSSRHGIHVGPSAVPATSLLTSDAQQATTFGSTSRTEVPHGTWMDVGTPTFEALAVCPSVGTVRIIAARDIGSGDRRFQFRISATGKLEVVLWTTVTSALTIAGATTLTPGQTYHLAATVDGTNVKLYVNGAADVTTAHAGTLLTTGTTGLALGANTGSNSFNFNGTLDEFAFYGTALSRERVVAHYLSGVYGADGPPGTTINGGLAEEADAALAGTTVAGALVAGGLASESDIALAGSVLSGEVVAGGLSTETDAGMAGSLTAGAVVAGGQALETDTALAGFVALAQFVAGGLALEVDQARPGTTIQPAQTNLGDGNGDDGDAYAVFTWDPPVVEPPVPFIFRDEIAAHAYTGVDTTGRPGLVGLTTKTRTRRWTRILVAGRDVTFLNGIATPEPTYSLISPLLYGSGSIAFPQYPAWLYGTAAIPAWIKPGAPVVIQRINEDLEVTGISYRGFLLDVNVSGRDLTFGLSGEASGRAALDDIPPRIFRKRNSLEFWWEGLIRDLHLPVGNSTTTGIVLQNRGGMDMLTYANELSANGAKRGGAVYTCMPNMDGEYRVVQKDKTTIDATVYFDDAHTKPDLRRDPAEEPNKIYATAVAPSGRRIRFADYPVLAVQKPLPYPMNDGSAFGIGTTDADTDTGGGVTAMLARLVWTGYLDPDDRPGGFDSDVADAIEDLQDEAGLAQTGNMNENTWDALYDIGISGPSIGGAQIRPAVQRSKVRRYNRTGSGQVLGPNPDYDPTVLPVAATKDYGTGNTKNQVLGMARADLHEAEASNWVGTIVFNTGGLILGEHAPGTAIGTVMDARQLKPGMNIWAPLFDGGTLFHVSGCEVGQTSDGRPLVTAQVDTRFRDTMAVAEIIDRNRESRISPARNWTRNYRSSGKVNDVVSEWDDVGGLLPGDVQLQGGRWNKIGMVAGQEGTISSLRIRLADEECESVVGVFGRDIEEEKLNRRIGNPLTPEGRAQWQDQGILEDLDEKHFLLYVAGSDEQPCGYWPKAKTDAGASLTGIHKDDAGFRYFAFDDASVWLMIFPTQDCTLRGGRLFRNQLESGS
jgi:hypothetical protein